MKGMVRLAFLFLALLTFFPLGAGAESLDDYYLNRFTALYGHQERAPLAAAAPATGGWEAQCLTPLYHALQRDWNSLAPGTRQILSKYVAKPALESPATFTSAQGHFAIHYATSGPDTPTPYNGLSVFDWVATVAAVFEEVYGHETGQTNGDLGYNPAPTLDSAPYDIYLQNLAPYEFGHTNADPPVTGSNSSASYIVIDKDFTSSAFGNYTGLAGLQMTAAHEYQHAIQYGYNYYFDIWYAEATSTWMEDEVYDSINQLYSYYLPNYLKNSTLSLDIPANIATGGGYSRWIFNRFLAEKYGKDIVRSIWELLSTKSSLGPDISMLPVIDEFLASRGGLPGDFFAFTKKLYRRDWQSHLAEIGLIPAIVPWASYGSYPVTDASSPAPTLALPHYSFAYLTFHPSATSPQDLLLGLTANGAGTTAVAFRKLTDADHTITEQPLDLNSGTIAVAGFNTSDTTEVVLLIANNSNFSVSLTVTAKTVTTKPELVSYFKNAMLILQMLSGINPSPTVPQNADGNGDGRIGLEDVLYLLQKAAEIR